MSNIESASGTRKRSVSESDVDRISDAVSNLSTNRSDALGVNIPEGLDVSRSSPNIHDQGSGLIDTPLGLGRGTRLQVRNNVDLGERKVRAEKACQLLIADINLWVDLMSASPPPELSVVNDGYQRFKRRIQRTSQEAILRRVSTNLTYELSGLQVKLKMIKSKAERRDRAQLNDPSYPIDTNPDNFGDEDEVFSLSQDEDENPGRNALQLQEPRNSYNDDNAILDQLEPSNVIQSDLNRSQLSTSIGQIINFVHDVSAGDRPPTPPPSNQNLNGEPSKILSIEASIRDIIRMCRETDQKLGIVVANSASNTIAIESLDNRVAKLDRDVKTYVDSKFNTVSEKISTVSMSVMKPRNVSESVESLKKEIKDLKIVQQRDQVTMSYLSNTIADVKDQFDASLDFAPSVSVLNSSSTTVRSRSDRINERELIKDSVENSARLIKQLIKNNISPSSELSSIQKANNDVKKITSYTKSCQDSLMKYVSYDGYDQSYLDTIKSLLQTANDWVLQVELIYTSSEAHAVNSSKGDTSAIGIFVNNAEKTVFEFFEEIEICLLGWGTGKQRASQLYNKHLSDDIKSQTIDIADNFSELKRWLVNEYGDPDTIVNEIVSSLSKLSKPIGENQRERFKYFSNISKSVARLDKLIRVPEIEIDELESVLYSKATLRKLFDTLPFVDLQNLGRAMAVNKLDWKNPKGVAAFAFFKDFVDTTRGLLDSFKEIGDEKQKSRAVFKIDSNTPPISHPVPQSSKNPPWFNPTLRFPCPLDRHVHELASCKEFLSMSPEDRWSKIGKGKVCYTCMKPKGTCKGRFCSRQSSVPEILLCSGCNPYAQVNGWTPFNILLCRKQQHAELRAPYDQIRISCEGYFGKLDGEIGETNLKYSVHFMNQVYSVTPYNRLNQEKPLNQEDSIPTVDSQTGRFIDQKDAVIVPEILEHAHYLMQHLRVGNSTMLAFFDRGANINLIDGELAERENLRKTSCKPSELTVVGGGAVVTEYGQYSFNLGPTEKNHFHEINCTGMDSVTGDFSQYNLNEIASEYYDSLLPGEPVQPVPKYTGGSNVKLLIGIKNTQLDPVLIKILPSGVGVYKSPFKDIWGSRLIFAGPHKSFSKGNSGLRNDVNHAVYKLHKIIDDNLSQKLAIPILIKVDPIENISIYPRPLSEQDLIDAGGAIEIDEFDPHRIEQLILDRRSSGKDWNECGAHAARIPISKIRELVDQDDVDQLVTYRCNSCLKCQECKKSPRLTTISIQEAREQELIEKSVKIDIENSKVTVDFPFLKNPTEFLTKKHGADSNYYQAKRVYISQCKKSEMDKIGTRMAHKELVERGFMVKLSSLSDDCQKFIQTAPFRHFYPWFIVSKIESISTPRRIVVDPSCTGLNTILPKGENRIGSLLDLLIRNRVKPVAWMSDISKLYNQLELERSAYPFSLFLYNDSLNKDTEPDIYVMLRAWYGVVQTGGQAGFALDKLGEMGADEYPKAKECIQRDRYVDDIIPGADTLEEVNEQINQVKKLLSTAGFSLKYVVKSGEPPGEKASTDGEHVKMLGHKWKTVEDIIYPGVAEFNVNRKVRGVQVPNEKPVTSREEAEAALKDIHLTRRLVISKIATLFDPLGIWEPIKLQLKLHSAALNSTPWDKHISSEQELFWKTKLPEFVDYENLSANRCVVPPDAESTSAIRLLCLSDAGVSAGGAAVYAGRKTKDGSWSCSLLVSKSRLMKATVPRNELDAIMLMAELGYVSKRALGSLVDQVFYFTDSTIALSWIHNTSIKLRAYTFARVEATRRLIQMTTGLEDIPIFHIEGTTNLADLLTKYHELSVKSLSIGSKWQQGEDWMKKDLADMNLRTYSDLKPNPTEEAEIKSECFQDAFLPDSETAAYSAQEKKENITECSIVNPPPPSY